MWHSGQLVERCLLKWIQSEQWVPAAEVLGGREKHVQRAAEKVKIRALLTPDQARAVAATKQKWQMLGEMLRGLLIGSFYLSLAAVPLALWIIFRGEDDVGRSAVVPPAAVRLSNIMAGEAQRYLRSRQVLLALSQPKEFRMGDNKLIIIQSFRSAEYPEGNTWRFRYSAPPRQLELVMGNEGVIFERE